jgi:predicted XRE-type DNA-binding protein
MRTGFWRARIGFHVFKILAEKELKQREIADVLGIAQPDVSHLMNGHFSRFTTDKMLDSAGSGGTRTGSMLF